MRGDTHDQRRTRQKRLLRAQALRKQIERHQPLPPVSPQKYRHAKDYPADPHHVDWRDPDHCYQTRLHRAVQQRDLDQVRTLLEKLGAHPVVKCNGGMTPLGVARNYGYSEIAEYLDAQVRALWRAWQRFEDTTDRRYRLGRGFFR